MDLFRLLSHSASSPYGPRPAFEPIDLLRALRLLSLSPVGRARLSEQLGIGEGSMRSLLAILVGRKLVRVEKTGCQLTPMGVKTAQGLAKSVVWTGDVDPHLLTFHLPAYGLLVRPVGRPLAKGLEQRDAAIRQGAMGATILQFQSGSYYFPGTREKVSPDGAVLLAQVPARNGDVLILSYGAAKILSERGAWAAAQTLLV